VTTTPNKGYPQPVINGNVNTWGTLLNLGFLTVDLNLGGVASVPVAGNVDVTVSASQVQNLVLQLVGTLTGNINLFFPANGGFWIVDNESAGSYTITAKTVSATSTSVVVPQGSQVVVYSDGTNLHGVGVQVIYTGTGLTGGPIVQNGTISLAPISTATMLANVSGATTAPTPTTMSQMLDASIGTAQGNLLYRNASGWVALPAGANGQVLQTSGAAANPIWTSLAALPATGVLADLANTAFAKGDMIYYNGTNMVRVAAGTYGQVMSEGANSTPTWKTQTASGIVPDFMFQNLGIR
jgi:hypothetical protein